ncbi:DUF779 domain-containing protein [Cellulophaga sp. BC115SP]|uniref:DUF779 domain-containing protein n=1 Tax=Cellulophaga sp. BC115SP TaxID=2683263 RepID=UPI001412D093|nr:DUF779 domain-containing protein [Cellulophaga sp. BC115SP]NBB27037.1 DUF779 domain-containing protein [Cellulophaga sp. BC115SP]
MNQIKITALAKDVVRQLQNRHGRLMFHISGGCCDGTQPQCYELGEFRLGEVDIKLGDVCECAIYTTNDQLAFWKDTELTLDVSPGKGGGFSLEAPLGVRFIMKSSKCALNS